MVTIILLHPPIQSMPITHKTLMVGALWNVCGFLCGLQFHSQIKLTNFMYLQN